MKHFCPIPINSCLASNCLKSFLKCEPFLQRFQRYFCEHMQPQKVKHLVCFKQWEPKMIQEVLCSARNLKYQLCDTHRQKMNLIPNAKVMILQDVNEPILNMAVSKAASLLGADDVSIVDHLVWDHDYHGRIFSDMADIIFVSSNTHACVKRFAERSTVPVLTMLSRTHATIQSLATIMAILDEFGTLEGLNIAYVGPPHPVLNSYLLLAPMLGANIKFKCCCKKCPVTPLLLMASKELTAKSFTVSKQCPELCDALKSASVIIAGPTTYKQEKIHEFMLNCKEITCKATEPWIFFHTLPRGEEVDDKLFWNSNSKTFTAFQNMQYIAAALMVYLIRGDAF